MKEMIRYGVTLAVICMCASGLLALMHTATRAKIIAQAQAEEEAALREVLPEASRFEPVKFGSESLYYQALDKDGKVVGFAFKASGKGYSSTIETLVGMDTGGVIKAIKVISQNETPGLGSRVEWPEFCDLFKGRAAVEVDLVKPMSGSTISSRAVMDSIKKKAQELLKVIRNEQ